ncbi:sulfatase-like hydrolase/transferase [Pelagicoccus mobilis]|uniref:Sulfatase-like hydrolase/transferase n=1 Tax=Pelagicoccus mobilis TaxID=415221 RepID=A0A934RWI6_9BACT|nr:sulfatase-like hydrolase/transferase [Pelagicoccus mobilis]MBK1877796.1 sulfatase-like hydrolase/transferase [Pelagicoccus mobilis]
MKVRLLNVYVCVLLAFASAVVGEERPNILIILTDDQGRDDFGYMNPEVFETPNLDRLRTESLEFTQFYVNPTCAPTRASFLTGRHFLETGVWGVHGGQDYINLDETLISERLQDVGYATAFYGKWHSGKSEGYLPWDRGFEVAELTHLYRHMDGMFFSKDGMIEREGWMGQALAEKASGFLRERSKASDSRPFCLHLSMMATHGKWYAPESRIQKYRDKGFTESLAVYAGMLEELDANVGSVLQTLEETGQSKNTVVLFFTDNGPVANSDRKDLPNHTGRDWELRNPSGLRGAKTKVYENGIRVPLLVRWPGRVEPGTEEGVAHVTDLFPTLLSIAGEAPKPRPGEKDLRGISLVPLLFGQGELPERPLFIASDHAQTEGGRGRYDFLNGPDAVDPQIQNLALRVGDRKLVRRGGRIELFDLSEDPRELRNIAKAEPEVAQLMSKQLLDTLEGIRKSGRAFQAPVFRIGSCADRSSFVFACSPSALLGSVKYGSHWTTGWDGVGDGQTHLVDVVTEGWYEVVLHAREGVKGAKIRVGCGEREILGTITGRYENAIGKLYLPKGKTTLRLVVEEESPKGGVMDSLKAIEFLGAGAERGEVYGF